MRVREGLCPTPVELLLAQSLREFKGLRITFLEKEGITTVAIGGATKIGRFLDLLSPVDLKVKLAGLYDIGEERYFRRALGRAGFASDLTRAGMERLFGHVGGG